MSTSLQKLAVALLAAAGLTSSAQEMDVALEPAFHLLRQAVEKDEVPGAVALVARHGRILRHEARGFRDIENQLLFTTNTLCWIASITKPVTAAAAMTLVDAGKLALDDPVEKYLPEFRNQTDTNGVAYAITVRQLMSHTSGLVPNPPTRRSGWPIGGPLDDFWLQQNLAEIVRTIARSQLRFKPGSKFEYSNSAYFVLGRVIEVLSDKPYALYVKEKIFQPLGMNDTHYAPPAADAKRVAKIYARREGARETIFQINPDLKISNAAPDGGLFSYPAQLVPLLQMFLDNDGRALSQKAVTEMLTAQPHGWGLGWSLQEGLFLHEGSSGTLAWADPRTGVIGILFLQYRDQNKSDERLRKDFRAAVQSAFAPPPASAVSDNPGKQLGSLGQFARWAKVEIVLRGPDSHGRGQPNPFAIAVDGTFTSAGGHTYRVPGFYDGDGKGGLDGNIWKVRFSADEAGEWTFTSESAQSRLDGVTASFTITEPPANAPNFYRWGRLEYPGTATNKIRYLKFRDGPYWLKAGCDDPENFLGGFRHYDTPAKRKAAVDYLAEHGINSLYIMTHTLDGDHKDVWPWLGRTAAEAKSNGGKDARFDTGKLEAWRDLFEHMQAKGVVPYLVLEDDSAWKGYDHSRYYREMIARFGYLPALLFNLGEENNENYPLAKGLELAALLDETDPFDHPRGIHNVNQPNDTYVDAPSVHFTAIQTGNPSSRASREMALRHNAMANEWIRRCQARNRRVLMVGFDEGRPELDRVAWWNAYIGGVVWEAHVLPPYDRPMSAWEPLWVELGGTRTFMESLPFWEMEPDNAVVKAGEAFCLAKPGVVYALYLPSGGSVTLNLAPEAGYEFDWWNPGNGKAGKFQGAGHVKGGTQSFTAPGPGDWALRIQAQASKKG